MNIDFSKAVQKPVDKSSLLAKSGEREDKLVRSTVTTKSGLVFRANEESQNRMMRVIVASIADESISDVQWEMIDLTVEKISIAEIKEAFNLAVKAQFVQ